MEIKLNPYTRYLFKQNIPYIVLFVIFTALSIFFPRYAISKFNENNNQIKEARSKLIELQQRKANLALSTSQKLFGSSEDVKLMASLIPDAEDYFSMILAINEISSKTGFNIVTYNVPLTGSESDKISLSVSGSGDRESFAKFLKDYSFSGGRLIIVDKIQFEPAEGGTITMNINFYNKDVSSIPNPKLTFDQIFKKLQDLKGKLNFVVKTQEEDVSAEEEFPIKPNPFSNL